MRRSADHRPVSAKALAQELPQEAWQTVCWREGTNADLNSRFAAVRLRPASRDYNLTEPTPSSIAARPLRTFPPLTMGRYTHADGMRQGRERGSAGIAFRPFHSARPNGSLQKIDGKPGLKYSGVNEDRVFHAVLTGKFLDDNVN
jgi:hypothetical protein